MIAFVGAHNWVSYAFVAGRLLFLLPFCLLLMLIGGQARPRLRAGVCLALLVLSLCGIHAYFQQAGFLNKAYVIPAPQIGRLIREAPGADRALVVVDHHSCNLHIDVAEGARTIELAGQQSFDQIAAQRDHAGPIWVVRGTHDVSREGWNRRVEELFAPRTAVRRYLFTPYSAFDHWLMTLAGWSEQPTHAVEVLEIRQPDSR